MLIDFSYNHKSDVSETNRLTHVKERLSSDAFLKEILLVVANLRIIKARLIMTEVDLFIKNIVGKWQSTSEMFFDPEKGESMKSYSEHEIHQTVKGNGFIISFKHSVKGEEPLSCESVFTFSGFADVKMVWIASDGEPQKYQGKMQNKILRMESLDSFGNEYSLIFDYSTTRRMKSSMKVTLPNKNKINLYQGSYCMLDL